MFLHLGVAKFSRRLISACIFSRYLLIKKLFDLNTGINYLARTDSSALLKALRREGAKIGRGVEIQLPMFFHELRDPCRLSIGDEVKIGRLVFLDLSSAICIGDRVTISMGSMLTTHMDTGHSRLKAIFPRKTGKIVIEDDCYLGCRTTVLAGVNLGRGSLVAAGSLVNQDMPTSVLAAGMPALGIRKL